LQLKIGSNTKCSIVKVFSEGLHQPFFSLAELGGLSFHYLLNKYTLDEE